MILSNNYLLTKAKRRKSIIQTTSTTTRKTTRRQLALLVGESGECEKKTNGTKEKKTPKRTEQGLQRKEEG